MKVTRILAAVLLVLAGGPVAAGACSGQFRWPTTVNGGAVPPLDATYLLGRPDGRVADFRGGDASATCTAFTACEAFDPAALAAMLGVDEATVAAASVIAFEAWGESFELSTWTVSGGGVSRVLDVPAEALASGTISSVAYAAFFGFPCDEPLDAWQFVLLDTGPVSPLAADFAVEVARGWGPHGSPDLDAIGVLESGALPALRSTWSRIRALYR